MLRDKRAMEEAVQSQTDSTERERGLRKVREGLVTSNKMDKTVVVAVTYQKKHPQYKKYIKRTKKYVAHDEENTCQIGDRVRIIEGRPLSKRKRWRLQTVVERAL